MDLIDLIIFLLLGINFSLFCLAVLFLALDILKPKKQESEKKKISTYGGYSYVAALLSMFTMIFLSYFFYF